MNELDEEIFIGANMIFYGWFEFEFNFEHATSS